MSKKTCPKCGKEYEGYVSFNKVGNDDVCFSCYKKGPPEQGAVEPPNIKAENSQSGKQTTGLSPEEKNRIYEEEKTRIEARDKIESDRTYPLRKLPNIIKTIILVPVIVFLGLIALAVLIPENSNSPANVSPNAPAKEVVYTIHNVVELENFIAAFGRNEPAAQGKYNGRKIRIAHALINRVVVGEVELRYINPDSPIISCRFDDDGKKQLAQLKQFSKITIDGICEGTAYYVALNHSHIE